MKPGSDPVDPRLREVRIRHPERWCDQRCLSLSLSSLPAPVQNSVFAASCLGENPELAC